MLVPDSLAQLGHELLADIPSDIGLDQEHLEVLEQILVDLGAVEESGDLAEDAATPRFLEPLFELDIGRAWRRKSRFRTTVTILGGGIGIDGAE